MAAGVADFAGRTQGGHCLAFGSVVAGITHLNRELAEKGQFTPQGA